MTPDEMQSMSAAVQSYGLNVEHMLMSRDLFFDLIVQNIMDGKRYTKRRYRRARGRAKQVMRNLDAQEHLDCDGEDQIAA